MLVGSTIDLTHCFVRYTTPSVIRQSWAAAHTKGRVPWIKPDLEDRMWEYLGGVIRGNGGMSHRVGGVDDHVHLAVTLPPTIALSKFLQLLKGSSSQWANDSELRWNGFGWQDGYSAFTVSESQLPTVINYISSQREHHSQTTFQDEVRQLLTRHGIAADERG